MPVEYQEQGAVGRRARRYLLVLHAFMCRWLVNVLWLLGIDVVRM